MTLGFPSFVGPGAADIGSTIAGGTPGSVLFVGAGSVLAQDNTNLFYDDPNNRLGIGTNAPAVALDVRGNSKIDVMIWGNTTEQARLTYGSLSDASAAAIIRSISGVKLGLGSNSNEHIVIATDGKVGVGTANPQDKLHIETATNNYGWRHSDGTITVGSYIGSSAGWLGTRSNHPLQFFTNNSAAQLILNTSGNLTIGATAPTHTLTIPSTGTGIAIYNTADQTTNYERVIHYFTSNEYQITAQKGGTGFIRNIRIGGLTSGGELAANSSSLPYIALKCPSINSAASPLMQLATMHTSAVLNASSGVQWFANITPTYNQTGTAGSIDLFINRTNTAIGSGVHSYLALGVGSVIQTSFKVNGPRRDVPSSTQTLSAGTATLANARVVKVQGNGAAVTITAAPSIADGEEGDIIEIQGQSSTNTVTYQDQGTLASSNLRLAATTRVLGARDTLILRFDGADWIEIGYTNVL